MNYAIILSGGIGSRMKGIDVPKQYYIVEDKPIIMYSVETIVNNKSIDGFIIVALDEWYQFIKKSMRDMGEYMSKFMGFALPGENRQMSIYNGLMFFRDKIQDDDIIFIHDAARPNITDDLITKCIENAKEYDGVIPVLEMKDTVYYSDTGKRINHLINRKKIFSGQAPEAFKYKKYLHANELLLPNEILKINGSTEPAFLAGMNISMINGLENNYKITTKFDLDKFKKEKENESIRT